MQHREALTGLLIGYGSVGRRHAEAIRAYCGQLAIIESNESARSRARQNHAADIVEPNLEALDGDGFPWESTLAIISTWGPSHAQIFHALADRGVKRVLCEKPLACSVAHAHCMVRRAKNESIALGVHHFVRYTQMGSALKRFAVDQELGPPVALQAQGGAACLVTNGIHWVDFAAELFDAPPERVISTCYGDHINPRSPDLLLLGGTSVWSFGDGREAVLTFSNYSSVALSVRVLYRDAVVETDADAAHVVIRRRDRESVARYPAVTRTGRATEVLFEGALPEMRSFQEAMAAALAEVAAARVDTAPATVGAAAVSSCIGALISSRERRSVDLPLDPESSWGQEQWPIS